MATTPATSDLMDVHPNAASCDTQFRLWGKRKAFCGRIRTICCFEDNLLVQQLLAEPGDGQVLVIDGGGSLRCTLMGEKMASLAMNSGWAGIIIYGAVRHSAAIDRLDFGVKALGTNPRRSGKHGEGAVDVPVCFGGTIFIPGHYLYSDEDGIVVAPQPLEI
ncbi:MAG: ribonuclease E activity regulator RraA [Terriglobales bacterium]|jgi:regulator of ribonuclease activity A